jgi:tRNA pseudouridine55 synthase
MDGVLILRKPPGPTSHDLVGLVRRLSGTKRVGHGGTLDPFAAGVLPVFLGLATRLVEYHMGDDKAYRATVCFGASSATDDRDGELVKGQGPAPTREAVVAALDGFRGQVEQRPPAFSALKVAGRRAYELAREGIATELAMRTVTIHRIELVEWDETDPERPTAVLDVECGAGTYIRAIARDLGELLGCGAYLGALTRTSSGPFRLEAAHDLDEVREAALGGPAGLAGLLLPIDAGLDGMASTQLTDAEVAAVSRGQQIKPVNHPNVEADKPLRLLDERGALVGVGTVKAGRIVPEKIFVAPPPSDPKEGDAASDGNARAADVAAAAKAPQSPEVREPRLRTVTLAGPAIVVGGVDELPSELGRLYVAVGVFDGLHRGHLYLLRELRQAAERAGAKAAVITFDAHPEEVVLGLAPPLLCDPDERLVRLAAAGAEVTVVQHFDHALRMTGYEEFVARIRSRVELAGFVMTPDAAFGHDRLGTPTTLAALGLRDGFVVSVVPSLLVDGEQVRSSEIRRRVADGDLAGARHLLGRPLSVIGRLTAEGDSTATGTGASTGEGAGDGAGRQNAPRRLEFDLPVTLPPSGRYSVLVGPAWGQSLPSEPARRPTLATVEEGSVLLEPARGVRASADRIRVVFVDRVVEQG